MVKHFLHSTFFINDNHLQEFDTTTFNSLLQEWIRYTAASSTDGYAISYSFYKWFR